jgi:hypothetical protein
MNGINVTDDKGRRRKSGVWLLGALPFFGDEVGCKFSGIGKNVAAIHPT